MPKSAPDAIHESEQRLRMALDAAGMVTWEWDIRADTIRYSENVTTLAAGEGVNPYCSVSGLLETVHPEDRERLSQALDRTVKDGCVFECEYRVRMLDGEYHWILGKGKSVVMEGGRPVRVLGVSQDITARKKAEKELQARSRQLAELTAELTMAEHRERRRLADLLHENLQQLLVVARNQVQTLAPGKDEEKNGDVGRLRKTLEDALSAARGVTRTLVPPLSLQKDLPTALRWLADDMRDRYALSIEVRVPRSLPALPEAITVLLFTAARELLLNIAKHAETRQGRLQLRRRTGAVELTVMDSGRGVDLRTMRSSHADAGFGLFSIRERTELLGGSLRVESAPAQGMRVVLSLPVRMEALGTAVPGSPVPAGDGRRTSFRGAPRTSRPIGGVIRIVFADDHQSVRQGMVSLLRRQRDFEVVGEAGDGRQAIERVRETRPDVVIMDVSMPVMDGVEATRRIAGEWPAVKVIGYSMYEDSAVAGRMREAGAVEYVTKSAPNEVLLKAIRRHGRST
jgi:signal transduction histidine kinase